MSSPDVKPTKEYLESDDRRNRIINSKADSIALSIFMLEECPTLCSCGNGLYIYNGKFYEYMEVKDVKKLFHKFVVKYGITKFWSKRGDVVDSVFSYDKVKKVEKMNDYEDLLCFNNGILNLSTKELIPHSDNYFFDSCVDVDYDPSKTECPNFLKYLNHVFDNNKDLVQNALMLGGYLIDTSTAAKMMFIFDGPGGSGKSTLIDTYSMFFHHAMDNTNQITSLSLETIASNSFSKEALVNSRVNLCAEAKKGYLPAEEIKRIVWGDFIEVARKFKENITFRPKTKLVVACNGAPKFEDGSDGISRRILIFPFKNRYKRKAEMTMVKNAELQRIYEQDPFLIDKIKEEKTSILNLFIEFLMILREANYNFIYNESMVTAMTEFRRDGDTVREFLEDNYEIDEKSETAIMEVYCHYKIWYRQNVQDSGIVKFRANEMGKRIKEIMGVAATSRKLFFNSETKEYESLSVYPVKRIIIEAPDDEFGDLATAIEQTQAGLDI